MPRQRHQHGAVTTSGRILAEQAAREALENGAKEKPSRREERIREEIDRMRRVVAEITAENLELKKRLGTEGGVPVRSLGEDPAPRLRPIAVNRLAQGGPLEELLSRPVVVLEGFESKGQRRKATPAIATASIDAGDHLVASNAASTLW